MWIRIGQIGNILPGSGSGSSSSLNKTDMKKNYCRLFQEISKYCPKYGLLKIVPTMTVTRKIKQLNGKLIFFF